MAAGTIFDILTKLNTAKNYAEIQPVIADLMEKVSGMHRDNQLLSEKVSKLEAEIAKSKEFGTEAERYTPNNEDTGVVTYALKQPAGPNEAAHRFCPTCFKHQKVRYLQPTPKSELIRELGGWFRVHTCNECHGTLTFHMVQRYNEPPRQYETDYNPYF